MSHAQSDLGNNSSKDDGGGDIQITQEQFNKSVLDHMKQMSGVVTNINDRLKGIEGNFQQNNPRLMRSRNSGQPPIGSGRYGASMRSDLPQYFEHDNLYSPDRATSPPPTDGFDMFDGTRAKVNASEREQLERDRIRQQQQLRQQEILDEQRRREQQTRNPYPGQGQPYPARSSYSAREAHSNLYHYLEGDICPPTRGPAEQLQEEFNCIKESLTSIRLPPSLHFADSRQGLKRESQAAYNSIAKSAKYVETTLKILSQLHTGDPVVRDLIITQAAHLKYLIEEQSALLVHGTFNDSTAKIYRTLQRHTTAFSDKESVDKLCSAVRLSSASGPDPAQNKNRQSGNYSQNRSTGPPFRGNQERGGGRGQRGRPNYSNWNQQHGDVDFPTRRPNSSNNQDSNAS